MENLPGEPDSGLEIDRLQAEYLERLRHLLRRAPAEVREDALREVQSHIEDEWREVGGGVNGFRNVLNRLGPPEEYGRDLALQLMLLNGRRSVSIGQIILAAIFWAGTSLIGAVVVICASLIFVFALGMIFTAVLRASGSLIMLIDARSFQFFGSQAGAFRFPPEGWSPVLILLVGLIPAVVVFVGLYRFLSLWVRSRLAQRGLALLAQGQPPVLPPGWEHRSLLAMLVFAVLGMGGCLLFTILGELVPVGQPGRVSLPDDFFRSPLTALAFFSGLVFLISPVLGLLWAAKRSARR